MPNPLSPEIFRFMRQLKKNNNRDWFNKNKPRYLDELREPLLQFISEFGKNLRRVNPHFVADPRPVGGSLFRIYRDTRFSKDKTPYKTSAGLHFRHEIGKDAHAPGFYLHLEPGGVFAAAGLWHPESSALKKIRDAIAEDPKGWKRVVSSKTFQSKCKLEGESLKRPPRGYDADHPFIEDIKRKDFITSMAMTEKQACAKDFPKRLESNFKVMKPLVGFLTKAVGATW